MVNTQALSRACVLIVLRHVILSRLDKGAMSPVRIDDSFRRPSSPQPREDVEGRRIRILAFQKIKALTVPLMGSITESITPTSSHARSLDTLTDLLESLPAAAFTPSVINYVLFPTTNLLRRSDPSALPDRFLEAVFRLLTLVVGRWRDVEGGIDFQAWEQLWRFTAMAMGPRTGDKKGKGRSTGQHTQLEAVCLLAVLLVPSELHPTTMMLQQTSSSKSPLMPTLFQSITFLLETATPSSPHTQLQLESLRILRCLFTTYLIGQHNVLASVLPGTVSRMTNLLGAGHLIKVDIGTAALELIRDAIISSLSDTDLRDLGVLKPTVVDLSGLAEGWQNAVDPLPPDRGSDASPAVSRFGSDPFPPLTSSYLSFTSTQLRTAIEPILTTHRHHPAPQVRLAVAHLSLTILSQCTESLKILQKQCLTSLLLLSQDDFSSVQQDASTKLRNALHDLPAGHFENSLIDLLSISVNTLPRLIRSHQDDKAKQAADLITAIAESKKPWDSSRASPIADLLGPNGRVERWSWALLDCLEFGRPTGWSAAGSNAQQIAQRAWQQDIAGQLPLLLAGDSESNDSAKRQSFPDLQLRYIENANTRNALFRMLHSMGMAAGKKALHSVTYLVSIAKANRSLQPAQSVSALWVAVCLLRGMTQAGVASKTLRRVLNDVAKLAVSDETDDDDDVDAGLPDEASDMSLMVERVKGVDALTILLDRPARSSATTAAETRRLNTMAQRALLICVSLRTLAFVSEVLSSSFRPLLLNVLYFVLGHLAYPQPLVAQHAEVALYQIAYYSGYASPQNLILDNVDYVINVVSQRLRPPRLDLSAPLVLIAMIRLIGDEIVPLVHDIVDEIFDTLDDYHGYENLASGLLAVLVTLVDVMQAEAVRSGLSQERLDKLREFDRIDKPPNSAVDFAKFEAWNHERAERARQQVEEVLERAPHQAWNKDGELTKPTESPSETEIPATRSQGVATQILAKSIHFLSHRSPFLRAKVLSLLASVTPVLALGNREADLLPLVDRAWPIILRRLEDESPFVVTEAAEVIAGLSEHVGDFMSRRILDHAWPQFRTLVRAQISHDQTSALARQGAVGTESQFSQSHRLYAAILRAVIWVVRLVPVEDTLLWEMMVTFRPFLDRRAHRELQSLAEELYLEVGKRDGDALWVVLTATLGQTQGVWGYLHDDSLQIGHLAAQLLDQI